MPVSLSSIVVATVLFALLASTLRPSLATSDSARLDAAAHELASLIRLAYAESIRLGVNHGVIHDPASNTFEVVQADTSSEPFTSAGVAYHPIRKQPIRWQPESWLTYSPNSNPFGYGANGASNQLLFDAWGTPVRKVGGVNQLLSTTDITLSSGSQQRIVRLHALVGRVVVL